MAEPAADPAAGAVTGRVTDLAAEPVTEPLGAPAAGPAAIVPPGRAARGNQVRQLFDRKSAAWPAKYASGGRLAGRLSGLATAVTRQVPAGGRVLDLGCGTGELARAAATAGLRVTGCDVSAAMLREATARDPGGQVDWVRLEPDWRALPAEQGSYQAVVASSVLEYLDDPAGVLAQCARVLVPGGVVLCTVPDVRHPVRWAEWLAALALARGPAARPLGALSPRLPEYLAYLRVSRQRHSARWWRAAAARAGLRPACPAGEPGAGSPAPTAGTGAGNTGPGGAGAVGTGAVGTGRSTLRLLVFERPADGAERG